MTPPPTSIDGTDITGATIDGQDVEEITVDGQTVFTATQPEPAGTHFYLVSRDDGTVEHQTLSTAFDLTTATNQPNQTQSVDSRAIHLSEDGTRYYRADLNTNEIVQFSLSTPYFIDTATQTNTLAQQSAHGFGLSPDGSLGFAINEKNPPEIVPLDFGVNFDLSTASKGSPLTPAYNLFDGVYGDSGNILVVCGADGRLHEFTLSTAFDVSTATETDSVPTTASDARGVEFNAAGNRLFVAARQDDLIREFSLSTPFDITTKSLLTSHTPVGTQPIGIAFN